jgi:hypothetical protein
MADGYEVVGDELVVPGGHRLPLAVPLPALDAWLDIDESQTFRVVHDAIRDLVMPAAAADYVREVEASDGARAVEITRRWSVAVAGRMGKCLSLSDFGGAAALLSPLTSGSDTDSAPTTPDPAPKSSKRTRTR